MAQISREQVQFGVVPGLARLGEVLANALNRQSDLNMRLEMARLKQGAPSSDLPSGSRFERVRRDLERAQADTNEASRIPQAPTGEVDLVTGEEVMAPDVSSGAKMVQGSSMAGTLPPPPEGAGEQEVANYTRFMGKVMTPIQEGLTRIGTLYDSATEEGNAPMTKKITEGVQNAILNDRMSPQSVVSSGIPELTKLFHMTETNPGILREVMSFYATGDQVQDSRAQRLIDMVDSLGIDPRQLGNIPGLLNQRVQEAMEGHQAQKLADTPPVERVNAFAKMVNPEVRAIPDGEINLVQNRANQRFLSGKEAIPGHQPTMGQFAVNGQPRPDLNPNPGYVKPVEVDKVYGEYIAADPNNRNYFTWVRDTEGGQAHDDEVLNVINHASDVRGIITRGLERAQGRAVGGGVIAPMYGLDGMLGGKQVEAGVGNDIVVKTAGRFRTSGVSGDLNAYRNAENIFKAAGFNAVDRQFGAALVQATDGKISVNEASQILQADKPQLIQLLNKLPQGEQFAIKRLMTAFGRTVSGQGLPVQKRFEVERPAQNTNRRGGSRRTKRNRNNPAFRNSGVYGGRGN